MLKRTPATVTVAAVTASLLTGCSGEVTATSVLSSGSNTLEPPTITLIGTVEATKDLEYTLRRSIRRNFNSANTVGESPCLPDPQTGVEEGDQVTVADPSTGEALGIGELDPGVIGGTGSEAPIDRPCNLSFRIYDVPDDREFYEFNVGGQGTIQFSRDDVSDPFIITVE